MLRWPVGRIDEECCSLVSSTSDESRPSRDPRRSVYNNDIREYTAIPVIMQGQLWQQVLQNCSNVLPILDDDSSRHRDTDNIIICGNGKWHCILSPWELPANFPALRGAAIKKYSTMRDEADAEAIHQEITGNNSNDELMVCSWLLSNGQLF